MELTAIIKNIDQQMVDTKAGTGTAALLHAPVGLNRSDLLSLRKHYSSWLDIKIVEDSTTHQLYLDFIGKPRR